MSSPSVTVLMPVHNGTAYLREAIESILNQSFNDFEFLIIDDGSTDDSVQIIHSYDDSRIRLIRNSKNLGVAATLNKGIELARSTYVARMDCDDVSAPNRLERQVQFMESHPEVGICGTWVEARENGKSSIARYPTAHDAIKCNLLFRNVLAHPSVIFRKAIFDKFGLHYDVFYKRAEDYELWVRASEICKLANLPEVLLSYRIHPSQVSGQFGMHQQSEANLVRAKQIARFGLQMSPEISELHQAIAERNLPYEKTMVLRAEAWLVNLIELNNKIMIYHCHDFVEAASETWFQLCSSGVNAGTWPLNIYSHSKLKKKGLASIKLQCGLIIKWLTASKI